MTTIIHAVTVPCAQQSGGSLDQASDQIDRDTLTATAESIVRDILQIVTAGRIDDDARAAFRDWIVDALAHAADRAAHANNSVRPPALPASSMRTR